MPSTEKGIILWGPPAIDWLNVSHKGRPDVFLSPQPGGIALLIRLLSYMLQNQATVHKPLCCQKLFQDLFEPNPSDYQPLDPRCRHTWSLWKKRGQPHRRGKPTAYRMDAAEISNWEPGTFSLGDPRPAGAAAEKQLLILDDPGEVKQNQRSKKETIELGWLEEKWTTYNKVTDILLRLDPPLPDIYNKLTETPLCKHLNSHPVLLNNTTVLTTVRKLRGDKVRIGAPLSWERMFDDVVLAADRSFENRFKRVVVTVGLCGAVVIENVSGGKTQTLVFDHHRQEGDFEAKLKGRVLGSSTCMMAALATAWVDDVLGWQDGSANRGTEKLTWPEAVRVGLEMMRELGWRGYVRNREKDRPILEFPLKELANIYDRTEAWLRPPRNGATSEEAASTAIHGDDLSPRTVAWPRKLAKDAWEEFPEGDLETFQRAEAPYRYDKTWTILGSAPGASSGGRRTPDVEALLESAKKIVKEGPQALKNVPVERVNKWYSADRGEIEGVRSVRNAIQDYMGKKEETKPLSIAVFGPPGAGKSFVVREIGKTLGIRDHLTFNLSQLKETSELAEAFHQARDRLLKGARPPLVFWDEFDSPFGDNNLGWLRFFLSPMQDGEFIDDGAVHPVGRGIYIFAGGTKPSFEEFTRGEPGTVEQERNMKKPDFISRLRAYIDVKGPNPNPTTEKDPFFLIRRAFLLRSCLERDAKPLRRSDGTFLLDEGVLDAFLGAKTSYRHGARSMENIVRLSAFEGRTKYELSSLPPEHLLEMHVENVSDFLEP